MSARLPLIVTRPFEPSPAAAAISIKPQDVTMAGLLAIALIFGYMFYKRREGGSKFNKERLEYARTLRRLVKS